MTAQYTQKRSTYEDEGVVLRVTKYSERKLIVDMLTHSHGRTTYIATIGRNTPRTIFQPLNLLSFSAVPSASEGGLHALREAVLNSVQCVAVSSPARAAIAMMLSELLYRVVHDSDSAIFDFVRHGILVLCTTSDPTRVANFHLHFLVKLAALLGYAPAQSYTSGDYFDIPLGEFTSTPPTHPLCLNPLCSAVLYACATTELGEELGIALNGEVRSAFLESLVAYYGYHTDAIYEVRSIEIFSQIF